MLKSRLLATMLLICLANCSYVFNLMKTPEQREAELEQLATKISKIYSWQTFEELMPISSIQMPFDNIRQLSKQYKSRKIKEVTIDQVSFKKESTKAFLVLEIKSFTTPSLTIQSHYDQIELKFDDRNEGWKITKIDLGMANSNLDKVSGGDR